MKNNKKDRKQKIKNVLKLVLNVFCYFCTGLFILMIILMCFNSCSSNKTTESPNFKFERQRAYEGAPIGMVYNAPLAKHYSNYEYRVDSTYTDYMYNVYLFNNFGFEFENDIYFRFQSTTEHTQYFFDNTTFSLTSFSAEGVNYRILDNKVKYYDSNNVETDISYNGTYVLFFFNFDRVNLGYTDIDEFYSRFTYLGSIYDFDNSVFNQTFNRTFFDYYLSNRFVNYRKYDGQYTINPSYDFENYSLYTVGSLRYVDSFDFSEPDLTERYLLDHVFYEYDSWHYLMSSGFNSSYNYDSVKLGERTTINGRYRYFYNYLIGVTSTEPYSYYTDLPIITFNGYVPYQSALDDFKLCFIAVDNNGFSNYSGSLYTTLYDMYRGYLNLMYGNYNTRNVLHWFKANSNFYFEGSSWKSFTGNVVVLPGDNRQYFLYGFNYYPQNATGNNNPIYNYALGSINIYQPSFIGFEGFNINDYYFFIFTGGYDVTFSESFLPDPNAPGNQNNPNLITGVYQAFDLVRMAFDGIAPLLALEIGKGVPIGALIFAPFVASMIIAVLKIFNHF